MTRMDPSSAATSSTSYPPDYTGVRYFSWMHPAAKARRMIIDTLLDVVIVVRPKVAAPPPWHLQCPHCHQFTLVFKQELARAPP